MIGLFFGGQAFKARFGSDLGNIELDALLDESHEWSAEATSNPVEEGSPVTDHVIEQADKLKLTCFVSDTPLNGSPALIGAIAPTQTVFDLLRDLIKARDVVTVYTKHRIYEDMVLTNVSIPRSPGVGEALEFSADFVHIRKVATQTVDVPPGISASKEAKADGKNADGTPGKKGAASSTAKKAESQKNAGKVQAEPPKKDASSSGLFRASQGVSSLFGG